MASYANERGIVTGGAGFLGRHVVLELQRRGISDIVVPRSRDFDLTHEADVERLFAEVKPTGVMHLAARVGGIGANRKHPGTFFRDNMAMGLHVLEAARRHAVRKVVVAGTICTYPKFAAVPFPEDDLWNGYPEETNAPYGIAKKALLVMAQSYRQEFGSNFVVVFPVNLNGDGKLDLAVANFFGDSVSALLGNGDGTFKTKVDFATGARPLSVAIGDLDGDGKPDLAAANKDSHTVSVLLGTGDGTFKTKVEYEAGDSPYSVTTGDLNGDGNLDLVIASYGSNTVGLLLGSGDGTFQPKVGHWTTTTPRSAAVGDLTGDGRLDVAVANGGSDTVSVFLAAGACN